VDSSSSSSSLKEVVSSGLRSSNPTKKSGKRMTFPSLAGVNAFGKSLEELMTLQVTHPSSRTQ
jgi:hypothetical protein